MNYNDTRDTEALGLITVSKIVNEMKCGWQQFNHINDNGIDGFIIDRVNGIDTGSNYYVQVKCGNAYIANAKKRPDMIGVNLGKEYIDSHRPRWNKIQGPVILIYVNPETGKAWWGSLKDDNLFCPTENMNIVLLNKHQRFGEHTIGDLRALRGFVDLDRDLDVIQLEGNEQMNIPISCTIKKTAKLFYKDWGNMSCQLLSNPVIGEIIISRVGWRHITRRGRGQQNIYQSFMLLGAAKRILMENSKPYQLRTPQITTIGNVRKTHDYISFRSRCIFPSRQEAVVQVVVKRLVIVDLQTGKTQNKNWFYSVYEPRRGKSMH